VIIRWTGLAPWEFDFPFPGSLTSTFLNPNPGGRGALLQRQLGDGANLPQVHLLFAKSIYYVGGQVARF